MGLDERADEQRGGCLPRAVHEVQGVCVRAVVVPLVHDDAVLGDHQAVAARELARVSVSRGDEVRRAQVVHLGSLDEPLAGPRAESLRAEANVRRGMAGDVDADEGGDEREREDDDAP